MSQRNWKCLISFFIFFLGMSPPWTNGAEKSITVEYQKKGEQRIVTGRQLDTNAFLFNESGKKKIRIVTLDWPPYIGKEICSMGWVEQVAVALLADRDYRIETVFYPWVRAVALAEKGKADILFPEYFIEPTAPSDIFPGTKRLDHLALSKKIPGGPITFMKKKDVPLTFNGDLKALEGEKIGVVRGYQNTPEFDSLMDKGFFHIDEAADDLTNAKKLVKGRVNLIIGDPAVIRFNIVNAPGIGAVEKNRMLNTIEVLKPVLQYNYLYFAVSKKRPNWQTLLDDLNGAIDEFASSGELQRIIRVTNQECGYPIPQSSGENLEKQN